MEFEKKMVKNNNNNDPSNLLSSIVLFLEIVLTNLEIDKSIKSVVEKYDQFKTSSIEKIDPSSDSEDDESEDENTKQEQIIVNENFDISKIHDPDSSFLQQQKNKIKKKNYKKIN